MRKAAALSTIISFLVTCVFLITYLSPEKGQSKNDKVLLSKIQKNGKARALVEKLFENRVSRLEQKIHSTKN